MDCFWNCTRAHIGNSTGRRCCRTSRISNKHRRPKQRSGCFSREISPSLCGLNSEKRFGDRRQSSSWFLAFCWYVYTERHAVARRHPTEACCLGYIVGWFAGWFGRQWRASSFSRVPNSVRSLASQAMIVVGLVALVIAVAGIGSGAQNHLIWTLCYGFLLAWITGWNGNRRQTRP
jgi:hypothetical protein